MKSVLSAIGQTIRARPLHATLVLLIITVTGQAVHANGVRGNAERAVREHSILAADLAATKGRLVAADAELRRERAAKDALAGEKRKADEAKRVAETAKHVAENARRDAEAKLAAAQGAANTPARAAVTTPQVAVPKPASTAASPPAAAVTTNTPAATKPAPSPPAPAPKRAPTPARVPAPKPAPAPQPLRVTATQLSTEYQSNEVAADAKYSGKELEVTGTVKSIDSGMFGSATVMLEGADLFYDVHCDIDDAQRDRAAKLTKGEKIVVRGKGGSEIIGSPIISDCTLT
jgi:hypothetical protein